MKYRKKPVDVEARQLTAAMLGPRRPWYARLICLFGHDFATVIEISARHNKTRRCITCGRCWVRTANGPVEVSPGTWIVESPGGDVWPISPDIFAATYEAVEEGGSREA